MLDQTYAQIGKVNGEPMNYEAWPLNESPWTYQQQAGNLFVFGPNRTLLWNYKNWTQATNNRPDHHRPRAPLTGGDGAPVEVNLAARVSDAETPATNLLFRVLGATNGTAQLLADGRTVRFTPAADFKGAGGFTFAAGDQFPHAKQIFHYDFEQAESDVRQPRRRRLHAGAQGHGGRGRAGFADGRHEHAAGAGPASARSRCGSPPPAWVRPSCRGRYIRPTSRSPTRTGRSPPGSTARPMPMTTSFSTSATATVTAAAAMNWKFIVRRSPRPSRSAITTPATSLDVDLNSAATVGTNEWHHLALTFQRAGHNTGHVRLYVDGALSGTVSNVTWALNQTGPVYLGGPAVNAVFSRTFNGLLDDVALWRGLLRATETSRGWRPVRRRRIGRLGGGRAR